MLLSNSTSPQMKNEGRIGITTGDRDGIGLEITVKALLEISDPGDGEFCIWRSRECDPKLIENLSSRFTLATAPNFPTAKRVFKSPQKKPILLDLNSDVSPARWVFEAAKLCLSGELRGLVNGPLSKSELFSAGFRFPGHNGLLKKMCRIRNSHMAFVGSEFSVVLATEHIPVRLVSVRLTFQSLSEALLHAEELRLMLKDPGPIAVLGLNPHAGEGGLIGGEELSLFAHLKEFAQEKNIPFVGPLVPDVAFQKKNGNRWGVYLALYHDQGLIPFKLVHGQNSGYQLTLGLSFPRTSVDHGTAKDLFGKGIANPSSMIEAIEACRKMVKIKSYG